MSFNLNIWAFTCVPKDISEWGCLKFTFLLFSCWVVSDSLQVHGLQHTRLLWPPSPGVCSNSCPLSYLTISSSASPFSFCLQSFPSIRVFSSESVLCIKWPKYWAFSLSISPSNEYSGLVSFRVHWFDLLAVQGILKSLFQHHNSKASITFTARHIHNWVSFLHWPSCFILSGAISNCPPFFPGSILDTFQSGRGLSSGVIFLFFIFCFSYFSCGSPGKNTEVGCHFLLQWTTFYQNSPLWPICPEWPYTAMLTASWSYTSPFATTRLWSMKGEVYFRNWHLFNFSGASVLPCTPQNTIWNLNGW